MVHVEEICARMAIRVEIPDELSENTKSALEHIGVTRLYSHQAESIQASLGGKNVVVATMTSSGKSLCYNVPVLEVLSQNLLSCALYLFPTKALAQDQLRALLAMTKGSDVSLKMGVYDGDTSEEDRMWLRDNARLLITNPDMLHMSILPFHGQFRRILSNLRFVIIDEAHAYKGAFGCHTAFILRRLRRLCHHVYGSDPSFIFCTATSANPRDHAMELANLPTLELIHNDGSPSGPKFFALWNPALCSKTVSKRSTSSTNISKSADENVIVKRSSPIWEISCLFAEMIQHGLRCIAFCKSRKLCELVLSYTREILQETAPHLVDSICAYRAGYVAQDRRRIESDFFSGKLCGIAATNALELGIDVGHIDVTLHLGFPGSIASLWQQAGRSGRRERPSLAIYVAFEGPLDQYFMKFPQKLFRRPIECCHVDAQNQQVLEQHLVCAALEHPLSLLYDEKYFGSGLNSAITSLTNRGYLSFDPSRGSSSRIWNYIGHAKIPSHAVSIRAIETEKYKVIDKGRDELLEEIEESKAFFQVYDGAVYMHQGKTYLVKELDISRKLALCQQADLKYYTKTRDYTDIHVIGGEIAYQARISRIQFARTTAQVHDCRVTTTWFGFRRIWKGSNKVFDTVELSLPTYSYQCSGSSTRDRAMEDQTSCAKICVVFSRMKPYVLMVALQFGSAGMYIISMATLNHGMSRFVLIVYRNAVAALAMAPFALLLERKIRPKITIAIFLKIMALGFLEPILDQNLSYLGMQYTSASFTSAVMNAVPAVTFVMAVVFRLEHIKIKERRSQAKIVGTVLTFSGALLMTLYKGPIIDLIWSHKTSHNANHSSTDTHWITGTLLILVGCCAWSAFYILQSITIKTYPAELSLSTLICLMGAIQSGAVGLVAERHPSAWAIGWDSRLLAPVYTGIVSSGLTYYVQGLVMKTRGPVFVTAFNPLCMIIVAALGTLILAEQLHLGSIIGAIIIAIGLYSVAWGKSKDQFGPTPTTTEEKGDAYELPISATEGSKLVIEANNYGDHAGKSNFPVKK